MVFESWSLILFSEILSSLCWSSTLQLSKVPYRSTLEDIRFFLPKNTKMVPFLKKSHTLQMSLTKYKAFPFSLKSVYNSSWKMRTLYRWNSNATNAIPMTNWAKHQGYTRSYQALSFESYSLHSYQASNSGVSTSRADQGRSKGKGKAIVEAYVVQTCYYDTTAQATIDSMVLVSR